MATTLAATGLTPNLAYDPTTAAVLPGSRVQAPVGSQTDDAGEATDVKGTLTPEEKSETGHPELELSSGIFSTFIEKDGQQVLVTWTKQEERVVVRRADLLLLPVFTASDSDPSLSGSLIYPSLSFQLLFFWMALDRANIGGVLTTTFLSDTHINRDQANIGTSLLWLGIVLLEIPSNVSWSSRRNGGPLTTFFRSCCIESDHIGGFLVK